MRHNKYTLPIVIALGFLLGISLSFSLRDYPILRLVAILCLAVVASSLFERGDA